MLTRWDPFAEMNRLQEQIWGRRAPAELANFRPAVDIREEADAYVVHCEMPGLKSEEVDVEVENGMLTIRGERKFTKDENEKKTFRRIERYYGSFERSFSLPDNADGGAVSAELKNGVLDVRIPKKAAPQPTKVTVKTT